MSDPHQEREHPKQPSAPKVQEPPVTTNAASGDKADLGHLDRIWSQSSGKSNPKQSRAFGSMFAFEPRSVKFDGSGTQLVTIRNTTDQRQTIDDWELAGDGSSFETNFVGRGSRALEPGQSVVFQIRFNAKDDQPRAAALLVRSTFDQSEPARLNVSGINRQAPAKQGEAECKTTSISSTTREGRPNSLQSAMSSVGAAWNAVLHQQTFGVEQVRQKAGTEIPKQPPGWHSAFDSIIAEGLVRALAAVGDHLSGGLAYATWNVLQRLQLDASAVAAEKRVTALTAQVHAGLVSGMATSITSAFVGSVRQSLLKDKDAVLPAAVRDAFFAAQAKSLSTVYADAVTSLNNSEGDYAALEAESAGVGFAALEAYRHHLMCADRVSTITANNTLGLWSAFLARMTVGTHEPESWEHAKSGAALEKNIYKSTDAQHRLRDVASGVLEIGVVWSYDRRRHAPIADIRHARVEGLQPDLKNMLLDARLGEFNMPVIVQGKVTKDSFAPNDKRQRTSQLRIARNEGGAITVAAEAGTLSAEILNDLGDGDAYAGAKALFSHVDGLTLKKVD